MNLKVIFSRQNYELSVVHRYFQSTLGQWQPRLMETFFHPLKTSFELLLGNNFDHLQLLHSQTLDWMKSDFLWLVLINICTFSKSYFALRSSHLRSFHVTLNGKTRDTKTSLRWYIVKTFIVGIAWKSKSVNILISLSFNLYYITYII